MDDDNEGPVEMLESMIVKDALESDLPDDDHDSPRDSWWLRWLKFISVIIVPAVTFGCGFVYASYVKLGHTQSHMNGMTDHNIRNNVDSPFWIGASIGGGLGAIYVVRCIFYKKDP